MQATISHDRQDEIPQAKVRWFQKLTGTASPISKTPHRICEFQRDNISRKNRRTRITARHPS